MIDELASAAVAVIEQIFSIARSPAAAIRRIRLADPEELIKQEDTFLCALAKTEHMSIEGIRLYVYSRDSRTEIVFYVPVQ